MILLAGSCRGRGRGGEVCVALLMMSWRSRTLKVGAWCAGVTSGCFPTGLLFLRCRQDLIVLFCVVFLFAGLGWGFLSTAIRNTTAPGEY